MMSSAAETFSLDHLAQHQPPPPLAEQEQLCYVHCNFCDTILAVGVPCSSLFKTVTVRCGHCANLLSVNLRGLLLPAAANQLPFGQALLSPTSPHGLLDEVPSFQAPQSLMTEQASPNVSSITSSNSSCANNTPATSMASAANKSAQREPQQPKSAQSATNRTSEKRQRVPSAYNRFIKDEIQRIKASNPDITHREAFSAAAKNWAHFPHIHFGLMPDQGLKKAGIQSQDGPGECMLFKDGLYAAAAAAAAATAASSMGVTPF
uniref:Uncharacterized protein n=1 Tax=Leersia perrieri TaxID=77586 RepID=A0A0D9W7L7_9ORYZ